MKWQFLHPQLEGFRMDLPETSDTAVVVSAVGDFRASLLEPEHAELEAMAEVRQLGFSSGRHCAHLAQRLLGFEPSPVLRRDRVPVWPAHSAGSITHSMKIAAAMASTEHRSVGIDIEKTGRVEKKLHRMLFTEAEKGKLAGYDFDAATVIFSAKEAGYKAIYPLGQAFIGFLEAQIHLIPAEHTFTIEYLGKHAPNAALHTGRGHWLQHDDHVLTIFVIP